MRNIKQKLNELVKQEYLWGYKIEDKHIIIRYGLASAKDIERIIDIENKDLKQAFLDSVEKIEEEINYLKLLSDLV